jgi:branched-subunit amino acid transport protein
MSDWLVVLLAGLGTYLLRVGAGPALVRLPERVDHVAALVAPAAFAALASTSLAAALGPDALRALPPLAAIVVTGLVVARTGARFVAPLVGLPTLWLLTALIPA